MEEPQPTSPGPPLTPEQVFQDYAPRIYNLARRMLSSDADAEDVTQDVLLQVVRKLHTFRGDADIGLSGIEDTPARRASAAPTIPYYEFREVLSVRDADASRFRSLGDLRGRRVATLARASRARRVGLGESEHGECCDRQLRCRPGRYPRTRREQPGGHQPG